MLQHSQILTPLEMFYKWESERSDSIYLRQPIDGIWQNYTWKNCGIEIRKMASALKALNYPPKTNIAILSKNCVHWILADYAIWLAGYTSVPLYPNITAHTLEQILEHSEAKAIFVGKLDDWVELKNGIPESLYKIEFHLYGEKGFNKWDEVCAQYSPYNENVIRDIDEVCTIMYTSGTTGMPKGVMHSFYNFGYAASKALPELNAMNNSQKFFSYLPMCHIAERLLVEMGCLYCGGMISFAESLDSFPKNLADTKPTIFLAVPRIWAKFQEKILQKMPQKKLNLFLSIPILNSIVKRKIKTTLGLTEAKNIFSGAAPIPIDLVLWFKKIGIEIQQAYAMTEDCCYSHVNLKEHNKIGTVGQRLPGVEIQFSDEGEIQIKHDAMMKGYFKEPVLTKDAFTDNGFFKTGDKGEADSETFLTITGRVKDMFKTSKGKYVSPSPIELKIASNTDIEQVCVVGLSLPQPIALIVLNESAKSKTKEDIENGIKETLSTINTGLDSFEKMEKAVIVKESWTIENNLMTPSLKVKRGDVEKKYQARYQEWFDAKGILVWE